jgi:hypothetical protein
MSTEPTPSTPAEAPAEPLFPPTSAPRFVDACSSPETIAAALRPKEKAALALAIAQSVLTVALTTALERVAARTEKTHN